MHPETRARLIARRERDDAETLAQQLARITAQHATEQPSLPDPEPVTTLITCTLNELHDLVYNGAAEYLHSLSRMPVERAREHATRISDMVVRASSWTDYTHRGRDPRG